MSTAREGARPQTLSSTCRGFVFSSLPYCSFHQLGSAATATVACAVAVASAPRHGSCSHVVFCAKRRLGFTTSPSLITQTPARSPAQVAPCWPQEIQLECPYARKSKHEESRNKHEEPRTETKAGQNKTKAEPHQEQPEQRAKPPTRVETLPGMQVEQLWPLTHSR